jgi:ribosomal protein S18 acetylase RimI-like enzyme
MSVSVYTCPFQNLGAIFNFFLYTKQAQYNIPHFSLTQGYNMKYFFRLVLPLAICFLNLIQGTEPTPKQTLLEIHSPIGTLIAYRPDLEELQKTSDRAKAIFLEAFSTTYTEYYRNSGSSEPIEKWLRLKDSFTLQSWLSATFDEEYEEYLAGLKSFVYLCNEQGKLIAWLSHSPVSETGDLYLSQCSLSADFHNKKVASTVFATIFQDDNIQKIFPEVKAIKLITRKINIIAQRLYTKVGFIMDETIDPSIYGESYDNRYVGYRLMLKN